MKKNINIQEIKIKKTDDDHMMETFPEPRGMPIEWSLSDLAHTKTHKDVQEDKDTVIMKKSAKENDDVNSEMKKDEEHLIEPFPKPRTMPHEWHCNNCD